MKRSIIVICLVLSTGIAHAQTEISYDIQTVETVGLQDINNKGDLIADLFSAGENAMLLTRKTKYKPVAIGCPGTPLDNTIPRQINNRGDVAGYCYSPTINDDVGFVRHPNGAFTFFDVTGKGGTSIYGINDHGQVVGQYFTFTGETHGFLWDGVRYITIDFPLAGARTLLLGINNKRKVVGAYFTVNPLTNETSEWTAFIWHNGTFEPLNYPNGGSWTFPLKINNEDQILGTFDDVEGGFLGGPAEPSGSYFIRDDNRFFKVVMPETMNGLRAAFDVNGMNDHGELVGEYRTFDCTPGVFECKVRRKGFIASPK